MIARMKTESLDAFAIEASVTHHFRQMRMTLGRVLFQRRNRRDVP
jgi:hypothetical protein